MKFLVTIEVTEQYKNPETEDITAKDVAESLRQEFSWPIFIVKAENA